MPDGSVVEAKEHRDVPNAATTEQSKLAACPPDKYIVAMADDVILSPEEWLDMIDYVKVVVPHLPEGSVYLLRKVEM